MNGTTSDNLNAAADYLDAFGWQQGSMGTDGGPRCTVGAIRGTLGKVDIFELCRSEEYQTVRRYLNADDALDGRLGGWFGVTGWNDDPARTAAEVIETLRAAALIAAASEVDVQVVSA